MDDQIRAIQEYVYSKYIETGDHGVLDEEEASKTLEEYYSQSENEHDPDCYFVGVLYFELGYEIEAKQIEYFHKAKHWLERWRVLTQEEWDAVDDRLLDIEDFFAEQGIEVEAAPVLEVVAPVLEVVAPEPTWAPHVIEEIEDHGRMMLIPAGSFLFSTRRIEVDLPPYYIDKYPVTNRDYEAFCRETNYRWPKYWNDTRFNDPECPVVGVSMADAMKYCRWVGKTIPTEEQWEKASRGSDGRLYPWGNEPPANGLACHGLDPVEAGTDSVTAHPNAVSPFGVLEMSGNVWEWTATVVDDTEPVQILKGGCYNDPPELLRCDVRLGAIPKDKYETIGFRCVKAI